MQPQGPIPKNAKGEGTYTADHIIVATGARPRALPGLEPDGKLIWTYFESMVPAKMPKSLLVMGSGAIGIEFASFYRTMGVEVTVVEVLPQVVPVEDAEIGAFARKAFEKQGMKIITSADHRPYRGREGRQADDHGRAHDLGGRRRRQYREYRAGSAGREDRSRLHRDR
jgi:dihydrolipoamide dehydrogenase